MSDLILLICIRRILKMCSTIMKADDYEVLGDYLIKESEMSKLNLPDDS